MTKTHVAVKTMLLQLLLAGLCVAPGRAYSANLDTTADHVLGQANFTSNTANQAGAVSATGLSSPIYVAIDRRTGRIWAADQTNNRVLSYPAMAALANGSPADFVLGQPNLTSNTVNNGGLSASSLAAPDCVALDAAGNVYVCDGSNHRVLIYNQPLTTDAAADVVIGQANFTSGASGTTAAKFNVPARLAFDSNGNLYVADNANNRVLGFAPPFTTGMSAFRVIGQPDFVSGTSNNGGLSATSLALPADVAFDSSNNLLVADEGNNRVLEYDAGFGSIAAATRVFGQGGVFTTATANKGGLGASSLSSPYGVTLDSSNRIFISDSANNRVVQYNSLSSTSASVVFGQPVFTTSTVNNGGVSASSLADPIGCALDNAGNLLIADHANHRILEYDLPIAAGVPALATIFPAVMATGSSDFSLYVKGTGFLSTSVVQINGVPRPTTFTGFTSLTAALTAADVASVGVAPITVMTPAPGGGTSSFAPLNIYVRVPNDTLADRVWGQPDFATGTSNTGGRSAHSLSGTYDLTIDSTGRLWAAEYINRRVLSWANATALTDGKDADFILGQPDFASLSTTPSASVISNTGGVLVDPAGNVYVSDTSNARVLIFNDPLHTDAVADVVLGQVDFVTVAPHGGGTPSAANLYGPYGLAMDAAGNLYVVDYVDSRVLRYTPPFVTHMNASKVYGQPDFTTVTPNTGGPSASTLSGPGYAAFDAQGNLYISDFSNGRVLEYDSPATNTTANRVFGQPDFTTIGSNTGGVSAKSMSGCDKLLFDAMGSLYVADANNNRILVFNSPLTSDGAANRVFGQGGSFTSDFTNNGGRGPGGFSFPNGMAFDAQRNLYVSEYGNSRIVCFDHPVENPPAVSSAATATPSTVLVGQTVNFSVAGTDPDNDPLAYSWDFGDGTTATGASTSHPYTLSGTFTATVTIDDGNFGTVTSSVMVTVKAPQPLGDVKLPIKLNFKKPNGDSITASGTLELAAGPVANPVTAQVADLLESFNLIGGKGSNADGKFTLTSKGSAARNAKFKLTLSKKSFAASLASAGLVNMNVTTTVHVPLTLTINGTVYQTSVSLNYTGKAGVSGKTK